MPDKKNVITPIHGSNKQNSTNSQNQQTQMGSNRQPCER